jgi:hypothetical protein
MTPLFLRFIIASIFLITINEALAFNEELVILFAFANFFAITVYGSSRLLESTLNENLANLKSNLINHKNVYFKLTLLLSNSLKLVKKFFSLIYSSSNNFLQYLTRFVFFFFSF